MLLVLKYYSVYLESICIYTKDQSMGLHHGTLTQGYPQSPGSKKVMPVSSRNKTRNMSDIK